MPSTSKRSGRPTSLPPGVIAGRILAVILLGAWAFVAASLIGFDPHDPPTHLVSPANDPVANWCGPAGATAAYHAIKLVGVGAYLFVLLAGIGLLHALIRREGATPAGRLANACLRLTGLAMLTGAVAGLQNLIFPASGPFPGFAGGQVGVVGVHELASRFGPFGAGLVLLLMAIIGAVVAADEWVIALTQWAWSWTRQRGAPAAWSAGKVATVAAGGATLAAGSLAARATRRAGDGMFSRIRAWFGAGAALAPRENDLDDDPAADPLAHEPQFPTPGQRPAKKTVRVALRPKQPDLSSVIAGLDDPDAPAGDDDDPPILDERARGVGRRPAQKPGATTPTDADPTPVTDPIDDAPGAPQVYDEAALREKISKLPIVFGQRDKAVATDADLRGMQGSPEAVEPESPDAPPKPYRFPGLDLLENPEENFNARLEEYVREQATALEAAMRQYRIDGEVVGIESGPVITLYDVRLAPGTKVAQIQAVASDVARALKAVNVRIVANQIGRDTIGIEVPNAQKEKVRLKELMAQTERFESMKLPTFLGKDASGEPLIEDLTKMPHMLIAGTTGSGKSVCMNTIIMGFLYTKKPSELKMVLVDPKMVEMSQFKDIPHLMCPVVTEMGKAAAILEWACSKMDERYELLAEAGCRDIAGYNDLDWDELKARINPKSPEEEARIPRKLPYMVFLIDELADLMMTAKEVESYIIRIAQKARAVGIHLILATQRPQANVVTGLIKSNMPCRIAFKVASGMDSRIVLDQKGGELLLGHGDMLFLSARSSKLTRAQGTLVDDHEIRRVVRFMREVAGPSFERQLLVIRRAENGSGLAGLTDEERALQSANNSSASLAAAQEDPLFPRAVEIVLETRRGSVSLLQRRLAIGYTRASRLIDLMGIAGIISDHKGSVARDVLITIEDWDAMKRLAAEQGVDLSGEPKQGSLFPAATPDATPDAEEASPSPDASSPDAIAVEDAPFDAEPSELDGESDAGEADNDHDEAVDEPHR